MSSVISPTDELGSKFQCFPFLGKRLNAVLVLWVVASLWQRLGKEGQVLLQPVKHPFSLSQEHIPNTNTSDWSPECGGVCEKAHCLTGRRSLAMKWDDREKPHKGTVSVVRGSKNKGNTEFWWSSKCKCLLLHLQLSYCTVFTEGIIQQQWNI